MTYPHLARVGTVTGGKEILVDVAAGLGHEGAVEVELLADYEVAEKPPGYPQRPGHTGVAHHLLGHKTVLRAGEKVKLIKPEARALIAAGAARLV